MALATLFGAFLYSSLDDSEPVGEPYRPFARGERQPFSNGKFHAKTTKAGSSPTDGTRRSPGRKAPTSTPLVARGRSGKAARTAKQAPVKNDSSPSVSPPLSDTATIETSRRASDRGAQTGKGEREQRALLRLFINTLERGDVTVVIRDDDILIPAFALTGWGIRLGGQESETATAALLSLNSLAPEIAWALDEEELALQLTVAPGLFETQSIDLALRAPADTEYGSHPSAYLNYAPRLTDGRKLDVFFEVGAAAGTSSLYSSAWSAHERGFVRGLTNFTFDEPASLNRIVVGDSFVSTGPLGAGAYVGGLTVSRSFELDPYLVRTPSFEFSDSASTPSTLEVYVNDNLVRREAVGPGPLEITNLNVPAGRGATRYVLRDAFGNEQRLASDYYMAEGLLAKGLSDYAYSVGLRRSKIGVASFDYGSGPGMLFRHRVGLSSALTLGFRGEAADDVVSAGPSLSLGTRLGQFDAGLSASSAAGGDGLAGLFAHSYFTRKASISSMVRLASNRYSTLSTSPLEDRDTLRAGLAGALALSRAVTASLQQTVSRSRDYGYSQRSTIRSNVRLSRELALFANASHGSAEIAPRWIEAFVGLSWAAGNSVHASATARLTSEGHEALVDVSKPLPAGTGYGFRTSAAAGDETRLFALGQAQGPYGRYQASYSRFGDRDTTTIEASGSIVAIKDGGIFFSRPVRQAFAVVHVEGAEGVRGYSQNREIGKTNSDGKLLVPDLLPYYGNRIGIADVDLPADFSVDKTERIVAPPFRGGAVVRFDARRIRFFRGRFVIERGGEKLLPSYGEITIGNGRRSETLPLGRQGEFELEGLMAGIYALAIDHPTASCRGIVEIPEADEPVTDLGEIICKVEPKPLEGGAP